MRQAITLFLFSLAVTAGIHGQLQRSVAHPTDRSGAGSPPTNGGLIQIRGRVTADIVINGRTERTGGIELRVCTQEAVGEPCAPTASTFAPDIARGEVLLTEESGAFSFCIAPGEYSLEVSGRQIETTKLWNLRVTSKGTGPISRRMRDQRGLSLFELSLVGDGPCSLPLPETLVGRRASTGIVGVTLENSGSSQDRAPATSASTVEHSQRVLSPSPATLPTDIMYVTPQGNDSNNGLSWSTAKRTIMAAYDALPSNGGAIHTSSGVAATSVPGQGIWIMGPGDPNFSNPPPGWRRSKPVVRFVGVGTSSAVANNMGVPAALVYAGTNGDPSKPAIWISGNNTTLAFENLKFQYPGIAIRLGVNSLGERDKSSSGVQNITFDGVQAEIQQTAGNGPTVDIGAGSFWIRFLNCTFSANVYGQSDVTADNRAAILVNPGAGPSSGLIFVEHTNLNGGGIKYYGGNTSWSLYVRNITNESDTSPLPPTVWIQRVNSSGYAFIDRVEQADAPVGSMPTVKIQGNVSASNILVLNVGPQAVDGPATIFGANPAATPGLGPGITPNAAGQLGFWGETPVDGAIAAGRISGMHDSSRRSFAPTVQRFPNLVSQIPSDWAKFGIGGDAVVTTGITAPDGTANAGRLSHTSPGQHYRQVFHERRPVNLGDWLIAGVWVRQASANGPYHYPLQIATMKNFLNNSPRNYLPVPAPLYNRDAGEWEWIAAAAKVTTLNETPDFVDMAFLVDAQHPMEYYAPIFLHIPAGTVSDNEAAEIATHLQSSPDGFAQPGTVAMLRGQQFAFASPNSNFFGILNHGNTANRTYVFPDASGNVALLNIPQTWTAEQTLISPELRNPEIGGEVLGSVPRSVFTAFLPGPLTTTYTAATFTPDKPIIVTGIEVALKTAPVGCATNATIRVSGSNDADLIVSGPSNESGLLNVEMAANVPIQLRLSIPASGCGTSPQDANVTVRYRMQ